METAESLSAIGRRQPHLRTFRTKRELTCKM
jgi:hypothetical protein